MQNKWKSFVVLFKFQIPEEEKNIGPQDRLIHVYHFTKDTAQNQMVNSFNGLLLFVYFLIFFISLLFMLILIVYFVFPLNFAANSKLRGSLFLGYTRR